MDVVEGVLSSSVGAWQTWSMNRDTLSDHGYRLPPAIISHAVWLSHRFGVSVHDVEDLLAQRGLTVGSVDARRLTHRQDRLGDIGHLDEDVTLQGQRRSLWRAVDQEGDVLDILVQARPPGRVVTDTLRSDRAAPRAVLPSVAQRTDRYAHHRAEVSHQPTRHRARHLRRGKAPGPAQRFLSVHGLVRTRFRGGRHPVRAAHHRERRRRSFLIGDAVTIAA